MIRRLHTVVTCAALLLFAWLTLRHVGEAAFLEDQVDQLQNFESLLRLRPEGLWGGIMSGTVPPARALGPLGAVVFGVPVAFGLGIDGIHAVTSLLIAMATAACFLVFTRIDSAFAWLWLLVFSATGLVWWNAAMLWSNTLLLPVGLIIAALTASCLRRPDRATLGWLIVAVLAALQLHLVAVVALPVVAIVGVVSFRDARPLRGRWHAWAIGAALVVTVAPNLLAEARSGFANTRAIAAHLGSSGVGSASGDAGGAVMALTIATDPTRLLSALGLGEVTAIVLGALIVLGTIAWLGARLRTPSPEDGDRSDRVVFWLAVCAVAGVAGQALFFWWMARPFAGYHHITLLSPFYAVAPAALLTRVLFTAPVPQTKVCVLGGVVLALLAGAGPSRADRFAERTPWSYGRIRAALEALCGGAAADTDEGQGFAARLNPRYDGVLRYMMTRGLTTCRYQAGSDIVIAAERAADYPAAKVIGQATLYREVVLPPGIARYRRDR